MLKFDLGNPEKRNKEVQLLIISFALIGLVLVVFGQVGGHQFIDYDDADYVYDNPVVRQGLTWAGVKWALAGAHADNWHPLTWLSHMLDCQLYGLNPAGHHWTNVILHTLTVVGLFWVLREMTGAMWRSGFVAAVFAIHLLRVESVAWVAERKDVLSGLFFVLTLWAYVKYARDKKGWKYGLALGCFALGLMSKPMLVSVPVVLLLVDYWPLQRSESWNRLVLEKLPFAALSAASCLVTLWAQAGAMRFGGVYSLPVRLSNALASFVIYIGQMIWPTHLAVLYPFPDFGPLKMLVILGAAMVAGILWLGWFLRRAQPWLLTGWLWYLVMLLPVLGIIQVGAQAHADRYTYLPQIGIYLTVTWGVAEWAVRQPVVARLLPGAAGLVIATLSFAAWKQTGYWQSSKTLWPHTIASTRENALAYYNLGTVFLRENDLDQAISCYKTAEKIRPEYANIQNNLGSALLRQGHADEAIVHFKRALELKPRYANAHFNLGGAYQGKGDFEKAMSEYKKALEIESAFAEVHYSLGDSFLQEGNPSAAIAQFQEALRLKPSLAPAEFEWALALQQQNQLNEAVFHLRAALKINPSYPQALVMLGDVLARKGDLTGEIRVLERAVRAAPNFAQAHNNLGAVLMQTGDFVGALREFQSAWELTPDQPDIENNLAWLLAVAPNASQRNGPRAVELAERANEQTGRKNPALLNTLAAALAEAGRFAEATQTAQTALALAQTAGQSALAAQLQGELAKFRAGVPLQH